MRAAALALLVVGCAAVETSLAPPAPLPSGPLRLTVVADTALGELGEKLETELDARLRLELRERGPFAPAETAALALEVEVLAADLGDPAANLTVGWDVGSPSYALVARLWQGTELVDGLRVEGRLTGPNGSSDAREDLVDDAAFRVWRFLWLRRPEEARDAAPP